MRIDDGTINVQMPQMLARVRSRQKAIGDDELVRCPKCDAEVDVEEDEAVVR